MIDDLPIEVRNKIEETLDWFDAEKVAKVCAFMDWKWATAEINGDGHPHPVEIRRMARELAYWAYQGTKDADENTSASGGIFVTCYKDPLEFSIKFVAVSA